MTAVAMPKYLDKQENSCCGNAKTDNASLQEIQTTSKIFANMTTILVTPKVDVTGLTERAAVAVSALWCEPWQDLSLGRFKKQTCPRDAFVNLNGVKRLVPPHRSIVELGRRLKSSIGAELHTLHDTTSVHIRGALYASGGGVDWRIMTRCAFATCCGSRNGGKFA
jgi:hypothetical protein